MKNLLSFFSRIPIRGDIERAREEIWLLPLLGFVTSAIPSLIIYFGLPLKGVVSVLCLYLIIGIIHLDGTADFIDGIMAQGGKAEKIRVMKSPDIGVAGVFTVVMILIIQVSSLNILPFWALILAEVNSKMSMILMLGKKTPLGKGMGKFFMEKMDGKKMFLSALVYLVCIAAISLTTSIITILLSLSLIVPFYIANISIKNFGGINGDCIGAAAELTRVSSLLISVGMLWYHGI